MSDDNKSLLAKYKIAAPQPLAKDDIIMVIEDQMDLRLIISHQVQKLGIGQARQAANGYEAVDIIKSQKLKVAAFVCDMDMPVMGGLDFLQELRENTEMSHGPFCMTMDNVSKEKIMLAVENGVDEILVKPFTLGDIVPKVRTAFNKFHNPSNPERVYELAKGYLREGKLDQAETVYKDLVEAAKKAARPVVGLARIEIKRGNHQQAFKYLDEAEQKNKNFVHLYSERAMLYGLLGDWDKALEGFKKAIELSPLNALRYKDAATILFKVKKYEEAVTLLESALKHNLEFPDLYHFLSQAKFALRDYKQAQKYIRQALQTSPENVNYLNQLGICLKETEQMDDAVKTYNSVIKLDPNNVEALYNKSVLLNAKGDTEEAIKLLDRLVKKAPDFAPAKAKLEQYQKDLAAKKKTA